MSARKVAEEVGHGRLQGYVYVEWGVWHAVHYAQDSPRPAIFETRAEAVAWVLEFWGGDPPAPPRPEYEVQHSLRRASYRRAE